MRSQFQCPIFARVSNPRSGHASTARNRFQPWNRFERILLPVEQITKETVTRFGERLIAQLPTLLFPEDEAAVGQRLAQLTEHGLCAVGTNNSYGITLGHRLGLSVHGGFGLNIVNTPALLACESDGLSSVTVSFELAMAKILALGGTLPRGIVSYGYLPLMHVRNCPFARQTAAVPATARVN